MGRINKRQAKKNKTKPFQQSQRARKAPKHYGFDETSSEAHIAIMNKVSSKIHANKGSIFHAYHTMLETTQQSFLDSELAALYFVYKALKKNSFNMLSFKDAMMGPFAEQLMEAMSLELRQLQAH